jgi:hypothetical protein
LLLISSRSLAQDIDPQAIKISVLTCSPGSALYSMYGHNAIRVIDRNAQTDIVYNWGTFDFETPGFMIKFMRGKLPYTLSIGDYYDFLDQYKYERRSVFEQTLFLDSLQKVKVLRALAVNLEPQNRFYKYDFFMDNCATRIRDIINNNVKILKWREGKGSDKTYRQLIKEYHSNFPWTDLGIDMIIGSRADRKTSHAEETFLPDYLLKALRNIHYDDPRESGIVFTESPVFQFANVDLSGPIKYLRSPYFFFLLLLLFEINLWFRGKRGKLPKWTNGYDRLWIWLLTAASLLMLVMWFWTDHIPTKDNFNVVWASPLIAIWWLLRRNPSGKWLYYVMTGLLVVSTLNAVWTFLPQYFHPIVAIICVIMIIKMHRTQGASSISLA